MFWRNDIPIHPACDLFPLLGEAESVALGQDIIKNGLTSPIAIVMVKNGPVLIDGRNRLDAMERVGLRVTLERSSTGAWKLLAQEQLEDGRWCGKALATSQAGATVTVVTSDPTEYIISANIHRRHLTTEQKRDVIAAIVKKDPMRSSLSIAKMIGADDKTVTSVKRELEARSEIPSVDKVVDTRGRRQPTRKPKATTTKPTVSDPEVATAPEPSPATAALNAMPVTLSDAPPSAPEQPVRAELTLEDILRLVGEQVTAGQISRSALGTFIWKLQTLKRTIPVNERSGGRGHREPRERAKAVLRQDPSLTKRQVMERAGCASKAALMARKELEEAGEIAPKTTKTTPEARRELEERA